MPAGYLRFPDVHADLVTFCAADDLWLVPAAGGRAWRLTSDETPVRDARFSPDGTRVAWTSSRDGHWEVMVLSLDEGEASRLTYWGSATTKVLGWAGPDAVLVASAAGEANARLSYVKKVYLDGRVERLPYGLAGGVAVHPTGAVAVSTPGSRTPAAWKRYRGGTASRLWLSASGADEWQPVLPEVPASLVSPLWFGDRLVFASDLEAVFPDRADGQANLHSVSRAGEDLQRHTSHTVVEGYVRDPASDGSRIVYHARGSLYRLDDLETGPTRMEITLGSAATGRRPRLLKPSEHLEQLRPDFGGDGSVALWRGKAFYLSHRDGPARALATDASVRVREPRLLGESERCVLVSDVEGEDCLEVHALDAQTPARRLASGQLGRVLAVQPDPTGERVATISHDGRVSLVDLADGGVRLLGTSSEGEAKGLTFSPDSRYLVWGEPVGHRNRLMVADLSQADAAPEPLTSGRFRDFSPSFTRDGKYLAFLSARTFDPSYDSHVFDLMFASAVRPYLIPLAATTPAPFGPSADGWRLSADPGSAVDSPDSGGDHQDVVDVQLDLDGFEDRILAFPVAAGSYRALQAARTGVVWVHEAPSAGVLGSARAGVKDDAPSDTLELFSLDSRKIETLVDKVDGYALTGDGRRIVVREGSTATVVPADRVVKHDDPARVAVDLDRLRYELDPVAEWVQMFDENARIMRDHYWREDMNGVDWDACVDRYRPLVPGLASHDDLVDVLWETVGELNTSHAYIQPANQPGDQQRRLGMLGADLSPAEGGWRIDTILPGESSDPEARSPLRAAGVGASVGEVVVAVNGRGVDPQFGPVAALVGAAEQPTELTLRPAAGGPDRRVVVMPLKNEEPLRYQAWVTERTAYVHQASEGRLGYLHIPDMVSSGWAQFHRAVDIATRAEGLIVDVRYNRGGHTSQLVVERLARKVIGWSVSRHHAVPGDYPAQSARGPVVFVTNEFAGSDGDIVNAAAQALRLGPVVGVRTWGGVVGIDGRFRLVDGTGITQPRYAYWLQGYDWKVENYGIDPDIEVAMTPADWHGTRDIQLDRAIAEALDRLAGTPATVPPPLPKPRVRPQQPG